MVRTFQPSQLDIIGGQVLPRFLLCSIIDWCSGSVTPDTILGSMIISKEVFKDKTKKKFYH